MATDERWYDDAVFYAVDVEAFADGNGDGVGDFPGLIDRLDHLDALGVDCVWLLPFYPSPNRDNGYDVADYYGVDDRHGTLGDFVAFVRAADRRGIRVLVDLVVNHTSDQHPWFRRAREDPDSPYRDYYVWVDDPPEWPDPDRGPVFPGEEDTVWSYDEAAEAFYYHRFYHFQPDLNVANPDVRTEIRNVMDFWLRLGVDGFRVDAATLMIDNKGGLESTRLDDPHGVIRDLRRFVARRGDDAVLLAEADDEPDRLADYFGDGDECNVLLNFLLDAYLVAALAERRADPLRRVLDLLPAIPEEGQWANFLRNYDELNLGRLPTADREAVFEAFAPDEAMGIYGRGIRRRLAPMLGDRDRIELAYSLLFSLPGAPLLVYGDEIGMGEDLSLPGRDAVRTPMQWADEPNGGFSPADADDLVRPVIAGGGYGYEAVNVADQRDDPDSLLRWFGRLIRTRHACPAIGTGACEVLDVDDPAVFAHRIAGDDGAVVAVHNLDDSPTAVSIALDGDPTVAFGRDGASVRPADDATDGSERARAWRFDLDGYGYCWVRPD
ncbi:alpha-amylase family protein [Halorussus marinus]|uniref:alpha-amylase family protein n=1 Tax=Halorussus marinus TaxID=2505976 RepID=UPI00106E3E15|nr:alpha-amylase family protein [Halorussus marinus]